MPVTKSYSTVVITDDRNRVMVPVPFDPDVVWGNKPEHRVHAGAFFDGLAQFYRRAFLRWIDATKRRPDERARRIAEMIDLLRRGEKERP